MRPLLLLLLTFGLFTCKEEVAAPVFQYRYEYFPLSIGQERLFVVDSILFDPLGNRVQIDSSKTFIKELVVDTFRNASNALEYRIERYERLDGTAPWVLKKVLSESRTVDQAQRFEDNFRLLKMAFPLKQGQSWNPLIFVDPLSKVEVKGEPLELFKGWETQVKSIDQSWNQYPNTLEIQFSNYENAIELRRGTERYAANLGLVYRELSVLNTQCLSACQGQPWEKKAQSGFILKMRRI
jgi:hypothetical protein